MCFCGCVRGRAVCKGGDHYAGAELPSNFDLWSAAALQARGGGLTSASKQPWQCVASGLSQPVQQPPSLDRVCFIDLINALKITRVMKMSPARIFPASASGSAHLYCFFSKDCMSTGL